MAFAHALKAALIARSRLTLFHVSPDMTAEWSDFPGVRQTLERCAAAARLVAGLARPTGTFTMLHVGAAGNMPAVERPQS